MKKIICMFMLVILVSLSESNAQQAPDSRSDSPKTEILSNLASVDDETALMQYALELWQTRPELFAGAQGVIVVGIIEGSQAEQHGLRRGDIITTYNGQAVNTAQELITVTQANAEKSQIQLQFIREEVIQTAILQGGRLGVNIVNFKDEESLQEFFQEFFIRWNKILKMQQSRDIEGIFRFLKANPIKAELLQQTLNELCQGEGKDVEFCQRLAPIEGLFQVMSEVDSMSTINSNLERLLAEGERAYDDADYQVALEKWKTGLERARTLKDKRYISDFLGNIGRVFVTLRQSNDALRYCEEALVIDRELGERADEGTILGYIGNVYYDLKQYHEALRYHEQALTIHQEINDLYGERRDLSNIGDVYYNLKQNQEALHYYEQALAISQELEDQEIEMSELDNIGNILCQLGQYPEALGYYLQALKIALELEARQMEETFLLKVVAIYREVGLPQKAWPYLEQALMIARELNDREMEGKMLNDLGQMCRSLGQSQKALHYLEQALTIARELDDRDMEGSSLNLIGSAYGALGQYQEALYHHGQALMIARELNDREMEGSSLTFLGSAYEALGQYQEALYYHGQALMIVRILTDRELKYTILMNLCSLYSKLGNYQEIDRYYIEVSTIIRELDNQRLYRNFALNTGLLYLYSEHYKESMPYLERALTTARQIGNRHGEMAPLRGLGDIYRMIGKYQDALRMYEEALIIARENDAYHDEGVLQGNIGMVYGNLGQYQKARVALQDSLTQHKMQGTLEGVWITQNSLALVEVKLNRPEIAIIFYEQALDTIEALREGVSEKELQLSFMQDKLFVYDEFIDLLQDLHKKHPNKGYDRKALEIFERKQGRVFLEEMGQSGARLFAGLPEEMSQKELDLALQAEQSHKRLVAERSKPLTDQDKDLIHTLEEQEAILLTEQTAFQEEIKTRYPNYYALKYPTPVSLEELQQAVLSPGELLFVYHVMEEKTLLWTISPKTMHMHSIPIGEEDLQQQIEALRRAMGVEYNKSKKPERGERRRSSAQDAPLSFAEASHALYELLIPETARSFLRKERSLHIVPTGPLYALPFEALVTEKPTPGPSQEGNLHYLIETLPISYLSSASLLKTIRESQAGRKISEQDPLLAFANPVYDSSSSSANNVQNAEGDVVEPQRPLLAMAGLQEEASGSFSFQALREQRYRDLIGGRFLELPETIEEVEKIAKILEVPDRDEALQLRDNASKSNIFALNAAEQLDDYQYLVFAAHGVLPGKADRITQPALVLSHPERDGYLTMAEVFQLQLNARLVVLSACNTGRGEQVRGEGVMGLTRAFMYAGTPAVAVTLWSVDSLSAKDLDIGMFEHLKEGQAPEEGQTPVQALRSIKLRMIRGEKGEAYRHPYYWAPFVLFGDGQ